MQPGGCEGVRERVVAGAVREGIAELEVESAGGDYRMWQGREVLEGDTAEGHSGTPHKV